MTKKYRLGYCKAIVYPGNYVQYQWLRQIASQCEKFILAIPDKAITDKLFISQVVYGDRYNYDDALQYWNDIRWIDQVVIVTEMDLSYQSAYEKYGFDMCCYGSYYGEQYEQDKILKSIIEKVENADVIIAPIADNRMFDLISEFVDGVITNEQCEHAIAATNLGNQYVVKTKKALEKLDFIKLFFLSSKEKDAYKNKRLENNNINLNKVKVSRIEYRGKGQYIDELLK